MAVNLSRLRQRKVKTQIQRAARPKVTRSLLDSEAVRVVVMVLAWLIGLWMIAPERFGDWHSLVTRGVALIVIVFGGLLLLRVGDVRQSVPRNAWLLLLVMLLLAISDMRLASLTGHRVARFFNLTSAAQQQPVTTLRADTTELDEAGLMTCAACRRRRESGGSRLGDTPAPQAFVPLLVALLYGGQAALVIGLMAGVAVALAQDFDLALFLLSLCATAVAASEATALRYRARIFTLLGRIALWQTPLVLVMALRCNSSTSELLWRLGWMLVWLAISGGVVMLILPLVERTTHLLSDLTLNSLADLGRPLLRRMALEAPGTYHHSIMVADLSQAAADKIGANGLLARVGAYYHDIGKIGRPAFYTENQMQRGANPHDSLPPNISRMIIVNHVKEGLVLARLHRLPQPVTRFIAVHHGTSVIRWFHHKAQKLAGNATSNERNQSEGHYRYEGPLPVSREETIVALADSVEAAARSLPKVTPARLEALVNDLALAKVSDGQFNESLITYAELAQVIHSFVNTLTHLLHARIAYPANEAHHATQPPTPAPH